MAIEPIDGFLCPASELSTYVRSLLEAGGANSETAEAVARVVVDASSRGVDTHGVRLVPWYMQMLEGGRINKNARVTYTKKADAVGHVDADNGFGHLASLRAIDEGIELARKAGVAAVSVGNSTHHGATGVYTLKAARAGFAAAGVELKALRGKHIRVRGVLFSSGGPAIEIRKPASLEILAGGGT